MFIKTVRSMSLRSWFVLIALSMIIGFCGVFGWSYGKSQTGGSASIDAPLELVLSVVASVVAAFVLLLVNAGLTKLAYRSLNKGDEPSKLDKVLPKFTPRSVALFALIIVVFWSPYLVAVFPGVLYNDTAVQMQQVYEGAHPLNIRFGGNAGLSDEEVELYAQLEDYEKKSSDITVTDAWLVDHHPFALTLFYGAVASASDALFGNWMPGLAFLMILQTILYAGVFSFTVAYLRSRGAPPSLCLTALLFFCLLPIVPNFVAMIMKDCVFALFFIPYFLMLVECVLTRGALFKRKRAIVAFVLIAVFMCLTKKTGVYVVGATALFGLIASLIALKRKKAASREEVANDPRSSAWAFFMQGGICALLMFAIVPYAIFPALNIAPGSKAEAFGFMFQQTVRSMMDYGRDSLTQEEKAAIAAIMRVGDIEWDYEAKTHDPIKIRVRADMTDEQFADYLKAYIAMGMRFPTSYIEAMLGSSAGYLAPVVATEPATKTFHWELSFDNDRPMLWHIEETDWMKDGIYGLWNFLYRVPVIGWLFNGCTYTLWIPIALLFFCLRNRLKGGILFMPFVVVTGFCLIGPVYDIRYCLPEIYLAPVLLGSMVALGKNVFKARALAAASGTSGTAAADREAATSSGPQDGEDRGKDMPEGEAHAAPAVQSLPRQSIQIEPLNASVESPSEKRAETDPTITPSADTPA